MYRYAQLRETVFKPENQRKLLKTAMKAKDMETATMGQLISGLCGDSWESMAIVEYLVELGVLRELHTASGRGQIPRTQDRKFSYIGAL